MGELSLSTIDKKIRKGDYDINQDIEKYISDITSEKEGKAREPGELENKAIDDTNERAFQRAIYYSWKKQKKYKNIEIEIPLTNARQTNKRIDLILEDDDGVTPVEVKYSADGESRTDNPLYAMLEIIVYYKLLIKNWKGLYGRTKQPLFEKEPNIKKLVVLANAKWFGIFEKEKGSFTKENMKTYFNNIKENLNIKIPIEFLKTEDYTFEKGEESPTDLNIEPTVWLLCK
jgi:hypothetical protein